MLWARSGRFPRIWPPLPAATPSPGAGDTCLRRVSSPWVSIGVMDRSVCAPGGTALPPPGCAAGSASTTRGSRLAHRASKEYVPDRETPGHVSRMFSEKASFSSFFKKTNLLLLKVGKSSLKSEFGFHLNQCEFKVIVNALLSCAELGRPEAS